MNEAEAMKKPGEIKTLKKAKKRGAGRPKGLTKEERKQMEKDLMGVLDPDISFGKSVRKPDENELKDCKIKLAAALQRAVTSNEVLKLMTNQSRQDEADEKDIRRRNALLKYVFKNEESSLRTEIFLQKLIPNVKKAARLKAMEDALDRFIPVFSELFVVGGSGWPKKNLSSLLDIPVTENDRFFTLALLKDTNGFISFGRAEVIAPIILSWCKICNSPKMRGSIAKRKSRNQTDSSGNLSILNGENHEPVGGTKNEAKTPVTD